MNGRSEIPPPGWRQFRQTPAIRISSTGAFDLVFSNSVIEHVGGPRHRRGFAETVHKLAPHHWVQTPYRYFPLEPHLIFPGFQFLPPASKVRIATHWPLSHIRGRADVDPVQYVMDHELLTITEMQALFPRSVILRERVGGIVKSLSPLPSRSRAFRRFASSAPPPSRPAQAARAQLPQRAGEDLVRVLHADSHDSAISGRPELAAEPQRNHLTGLLAQLRKSGGQVGVEPQVGLELDPRQLGLREPILGDRLEAAPALAAKSVDQEISGDRDQPCPDRSPLRIELAPSAQRLLERLLGQILGIGARLDPVGDEAVHPEDMLLIDLREVISHCFATTTIRIEPPRTAHWSRGTLRSPTPSASLTRTPSYFLTTLSQR